MRIIAVGTLKSFWEAPASHQKMTFLHPVRTVSEHRHALAAITALMDALPGTPQGDRLDILVTLVEAYEAAKTPIDAPDPVDAIHFMMDQKNLTRRDLQPAIGSRARVAEILNRRRPLTLPMIRALSQLLDLPADILVQPYETHSARPRAVAA